MGAEVIVPMVIAAVASGAQYYNQDKLQKRQNADIVAGINQQAKHQREADARLNQEISKLEQSDGSSERRAAQQQFMGQLQRTRAARAGSEQAVPGASSRYTADVAEGAEASQAQASRLAELMGAIDAPARQRTREMQGFGDVMSDIDLIKGRSQADDFLTQLKMKNRRANPWIDAASQVAQAYAMSSATTGGGRGTAGMGAEQEAAKRGLSNYSLADGLR